MKRLVRKSNHVTEYPNTEVEDKVTHPFTNVDENKNPAFLLAKQLFAATTYNMDSDLGYQFARKIENGEYDSISSIEEASQHWGEWLRALEQFIADSQKAMTQTALKKKQSKITF